MSRRGVRAAGLHPVAAPRHRQGDPLRLAEAPRLLVDLRPPAAVHPPRAGVRLLVEARHRAAAVPRAAEAVPLPVPAEVAEVVLPRAAEVRHPRAALAEAHLRVEAVHRPAVAVEAVPLRVLQEAEAVPLPRPAVAEAPLIRPAALRRARAAAPIQPAWTTAIRAKTARKRTASARRKRTNDPVILRDRRSARRICLFCSERPVTLHSALAVDYPVL